MDRVNDAILLQKLVAKSLLPIRCITKYICNFNEINVTWKNWFQMIIILITLSQKNIPGTYYVGTRLCIVF